MDGFSFLHPSTSPMSSTRFRVRATRKDVWDESSLIQLSASFTDGIFLDGESSELKSSQNEDVGDICSEETERATKMRYPWTEVQTWALRDNLPKYTIHIPMKEKSPFLPSILAGTEKHAKTNEGTVLSSFALWRSLQQEVPELSGYPLEFLQNQVVDNSDDDDILDGSHVQPFDGAINNPKLGILPFLQDYEFTSDGGVRGYVFGLDGISDGSCIETSAVTNIKESLSKGYIQTSDGYACYELGSPAQNDERNTAKGTLSTTAAVTKFTLEKMSNSGSTNGFRSLFGSMKDDDPILLRFGATSGILLAGATALNLLSHHLTVNFFWV